jgi:hypothetical protein
MRWCAVAVLAALAGCDNAQSLTCELLADPANCWAQAASALAACLPDRALPGTLAADRTSCGFADGALVTFDAALPSDTSGLERLAFTIGSGGTTCGRFVDTFANRMELTAGGKTVVSELLGGRQFHLRCDGGPDYQADFDLLFTCTTPYSAPTDGFNVTATTFEFSISAVSTPGVLFTCTR